MNGYHDQGNIYVVYPQEPITERYSYIPTNLSNYSQSQYTFSTPSGDYGSRVYPVEQPHPVVQKRITNIYYLDEFGNRIPGPEAITGEYPTTGPMYTATTGPTYTAATGPSYTATTGPTYTPAPPAVHRPSKRRSSTPPDARNNEWDNRADHRSPNRLVRSGSTNDLWDRLSKPKPPKEEDHPAVSKPRLPDDERQKVVERLLMPRNSHEPSEDDGFDPNLRTVYRKMTPEDLDMFVYRMYAPHKHAAPRRDIYDEQKEIEKMANSFRDDGPVEKPPMDFRRPAFDEMDEDESRPVVKMTEEERKATAQRLYDAAKQKREKRKFIEEQHEKEEMAHMSGPKLKSEDMKAMQERLYKLPKPHPPPPDDRKPCVLSTGALNRRIENWTKPRVLKEPEIPLDCSKARRVKMTRTAYEEFEQRLTQPIGREKIWRESNPVISGMKRKEMDKKNKDSNTPWKNIW